MLDEIRDLPQSLALGCTYRIQLEQFSLSQHCKIISLFDSFFQQFFFWLLTSDFLRQAMWFQSHLIAFGVLQRLEYPVLFRFQAVH